MKGIVSFIVGVVALAPVSALSQSPQPSVEQLRATLQTLKTLNGLAPDQPDGRGGAQTRGAPGSTIPADVLGPLADESFEFLSKYGRDRVIYGADNRKNYDDPKTTSGEQRAADATAVFVRPDALSSNGNGTYDLPTRNAGFCRPEDVGPGRRYERFYDEPTPGFCTGFKVGPNLIATAGHCVKTMEDCANTRLVFGFRVSSAKASPAREISGRNIYRCTRIVAGELGSDGDWRLIRVDRAIAGVPQVTLRTSDQGEPTLGTKLTVVGYPTGLPVKVAPGATVRRQEDAYMVADLDTYGGNSGSPVFNSDQLRRGELLVEGILVRGDDDFAQSSPCRLSKRCPTFEQCRGEDVNYTFRLHDALLKAAKSTEE